MKIPETAFEQHGIVLGKTGAGKSYALRGFVEHLLDKGHRVCVVDPKGDWWGLRSGYPVVIFGGEHGDVPTNEHVGGQIAELIGTGNRPAIIDFGGWMVGERMRFWIDFASGLFKHNRGPLWLVIDEVHNFAPQGKIQDPTAGKCLHWTNRLASEGRGRGLRIWMASQRPQKVHKDTLTCAETLVAMRVIHPLDRDAMKDWIDGCGNPQQGKEVLNSLAQMPRGEAWVWSPSIGFLEKVAFPKIKTFDSFAAPTSNEKAMPKGWADVDLDEIKIRLSKVVEDAKANDPLELKREIARLKKEASTRVPVAAVVKPAKPVEVPVLVYTELHHIKCVLETFHEASKDLAAVEASMTQIKPLLAKIESEIAKFTVLTGKNKNHWTLPAAEHKRPPVVRPAQSEIQIRRQERAVTTSNGHLPIGEKKILQACLQYPDGLRREQLTVLTGYKRSSRDAYIQRLREKAMVSTDNDLILATDAGEAALPDAEPLPSGEALKSYWLSRLPQGERAIFEILLECYPDAVDRETLSERTEYQRSSRDAYIQRMRAKQILTEPSRGEVRASDQLFA